MPFIFILLLINISIPIHTQAISQQLNFESAPSKSFQYFYDQTEHLMNNMLRFAPSGHCNGCLKAISEIEHFLLIHDHLRIKILKDHVFFLIIERLETEMLYFHPLKNEFFASPYRRFLHQLLLNWLQLHYFGQPFEEMSQISQRLMQSEFKTIKAAFLSNILFDEEDSDWIIRIAENADNSNIKIVLADNPLILLGRDSRVRLAKTLWEQSSRKEQIRLLHKFKHALKIDGKLSRFNQQFMEWLLNNEDLRLKNLALGHMNIVGIENDPDLVWKFFKANEINQSKFYDALGVRICSDSLKDIFPSIWLWTDENVKYMVRDKLLNSNLCKTYYSMLSRPYTESTTCDSFLSKTN